MNSWRSRYSWRWCCCCWCQCKLDSFVHTDTKPAHAAANLIIFEPTRFAHCDIFGEESFPGIFTESFSFWKWYLRDIGFACKVINIMQFAVVKIWHHLVPSGWNLFAVFEAGIEREGSVTGRVLVSCIFLDNQRPFVANSKVVSGCSSQV